MFTINIKKNKGFTLIELMVVIAIIGFLSSVVLASLNSARLKGRDSAVLSQMIQLRNILELEYARVGNYTALQQGWVHSLAECDTKYPTSGTVNVVEMNKFCKAIYAVSDDDPGGYMDGSRFYAGTEGFLTKYSMMVYLPGKKLWQCVGSSGVSTVLHRQWYIATPAPAGCYGNP